MDSTNSGSIQSSSSGDDYYDQQTDAISSSSNLPPPPPPPPPQLFSSHHLHHHPSPFSISLWPDVNTSPSTPPVPNPLGLDMTWAGYLHPSSPIERGCTINLDGLTTTTTTSSSSSSKTMAVAALGLGPPSGSISLNPSVQLPTQLPARPTGSKKRSRASRRAPTTVLATDTSNFRAMVQEFTGFPAAPFISSPFSRPRLDLFHSATTAPTYRPFGPLAPKLQAPFFAPNSSPSSYTAHRAAYFSRISDANASTSPASTPSKTSSCSATSSSNYQLPSVFIQHPNLLNMESPHFTFQSSLQPRTLPYHNSSTMPAFEANQSLGPSNLAAGVPAGSIIAMEEGLKPSTRRSTGGFLGWADGSPSEDRDRSQFRTVTGNYDNLHHLGNHAEKGSESRVDPWTISSD